MTRAIVLWLALFGICLGLGYPTLNRYDPRHTGGLADTTTYYELAVHGPDHADAQLKYRLLVPLMARPLAHLAEGHIGTWDPVFLGFLIVNALFTATTAYLLIAAARILGQPEPVALLGATLYLLNFEVANIRMSGMVDSAEGCFLMAIVLSLISRRYLFLPLWGILGAAAKETFVPLCIAFTATWWFVSAKKERRLVMLAPAVTSLIGIAVLQSVVSGHMLLPWQFASQLSEGSPIAALRDNLFDRNLLYCVVWLLPLGLLRARRLPNSWTAACFAAVIMDFVLVTWHGSSPGAAARPFFSVAGPLLSLSAAMYLSESA